MGTSLIELIKGVSLKTQNSLYITSYVIANLAIYAAFTLGIDNVNANLESIFSKVNAKEGFIFSIAPIIALMLAHFISADWKAVFVFWRIKYPLPGCRVFSELAPKDLRINLDIIKNKIGLLPIDPIQQNQIWYKFSKTYGDHTTVKSSHRHYLLMRDLTSIAVVSALPLSMSLLITTGNSFLAFIYLLVWAGQYIALAQVAKNYGERFACNVLAELSADSNNKQ
jgi:hypothetical protein